MKLLVKPKLAERTDGGLPDGGLPHVICRFENVEGMIVLTRQDLHNLDEDVFRHDFAVSGDLEFVTISSRGTLAVGAHVVYLAGYADTDVPFPMPSNRKWSRIHESLLEELRQSLWHEALGEVTVVVTDDLFEIRCAKVDGPFDGLPEHKDKYTLKARVLP